MQNITAIIAETIFMEIDQIIDLQYKSANTFAITDNCGDTYVMSVCKII